MLIFWHKADHGQSSQQTIQIEVCGGDNEMGFLRQPPPFFSRALSTVIFPSKPHHHFPGQAPPPVSTTLDISLNLTFDDADIDCELASRYCSGDICAVIFPMTDIARRWK